MPTAKAYTQLATITGSQLEVSRQRCNLATGAVRWPYQALSFNSDVHCYDLLIYREARPASIGQP